MLVEKLAVCSFCGAQKFFNVEHDTSEEELNVMATQTCDCEDARNARGMKIAIDAINQLLGEESVSKGFDHVVNEDTITEVQSFCSCILDGLMDKVSFTEPNGDTIKLVRNGYTVKVQRTSKKQIAI